MIDDYEVPKPTKAQREYNELKRIREAKAEKWKRVMRAVNAYDKLCAEERKILKRQEPPKQKAELKVTSDEWHKIRHQDFGDTVADIC